MIARLILFLTLALPALAADYALPSANQGAWTPGTDVGVDGGIWQYRAGGVNQRTNAAGVNVRSAISGSSYIAAGNNVSTTGTATGGSTTVSLADASSFAVGHGIRFRSQSTMLVVVTSAPTSSGNITITVNGTAYTVSVTNGWTIAQVANAIAIASMGGATKAKYGTTGCVIVTLDTGGTYPSGSFSGGSTGAAGTVTIHPPSYAGRQTVTLNVSAGATADGNITVTLNGTAHNVAVLNGDTAAQVAAKLVAASYSNATASAPSATTVSLITTDRGTSANCSFSGGSTGVVATRSVAYAAYTRRVTAVSGNDVTVDTAIPTGFTDQVIHHDDGPALQAAVNATTAGKVVYVPAGTYQIETAVFIPPSKDEITIRGDGPNDTIFHGVGLQSKLFTTGSGWNDATPRTISGSKIKATGSTSVLEVSSTTGFTAGALAVVRVENEEDNTRILAGAAPTWSQSAFRNQRQSVGLITAVGTGTVTISPGLPWDCTNYAAQILYSNVTAAEKVGFEDFSVSFDEYLHPESGIVLTGTKNCWVYNVETPNWSSNTSAGQFVNLQYSVKAEIRHCKSVSTTGSSSDGMIHILYASSCLIEDNISLNGDTFIYEYGKVTNCVYGYNFVLNEQAGSRLGINQHNAHPSLVLLEGNMLPNYQTDGYHGSSSHNTLIRNWLHGTNVGKTLAGFVMGLKRFTRYNVHIGNVLGWDGFNGAGLSYGQPNIGNSSSTGTAGPISDGTFWDHWGRSGTVASKASDSSGVVTVSGGNWESILSGGGLVSVVWDSKTKQRGNMVLSGVSGSNLTLSGGLGTAFPDTATTLDIVQPNIVGFQELDNDVAATTSDVHYYQSALAGTGSVVNSTADTLPDSLAYTTTPTWWPPSLPFPPIDPNSPSFSYEALPAGYRYVNGFEAGGTPIVATPAFTPSGTTHSTPQTIYAASSTSGATFYYTLDGTTPTTSSFLYDDGAGVSLTYGTTTVKMYGVKDGHTDSAVRSATYVIAAAPSEGGTATIQTLNISGSLNIQ
jgi:hypothetical protein